MAFLSGGDALAAYRIGIQHCVTACHFLLDCPPDPAQQATKAARLGGDSGAESTMINHPNRSMAGRYRTADAVIIGASLPHFTMIKTAIAKQFEFMGQHQLFRTGVEKDDLWSTYLSSFPPGSNPIFRERTEHDCSCCKQFIRAVGNAVAVIDGKLTTIWDVTINDLAYQAVVDAMSSLVRSQPIDNLFLHTDRVAGTDKNFEDALGGVKTWEHFFVNIPNGQRGTKNFVCAKADIGPKLSEATALHDVLLRSLVEIKRDAVETVLDLISQGSLYRGEENKFAIAKFQETQTAYDVLPPDVCDNYAWLRINDLPASVSKIRNTSIGTLLTELSEGMELEDAVRRFEAMVAPANYKRPTALVTPAMVAKAKATVEELGLTSALTRRYATLADITVNNILFADRNAKKLMTTDVFDTIAGATTVKPKALDRVEEVGIEKFLADILPQASAIELLFENRHASNLVSLIAPEDPTAAEMFKWNNRFSWSYNGDFADSIKERVKKAGGNVSGDLCCRLGWYNYDDLDLHMIEPTKNQIFYGNKTSSSTGGRLDVDMNAFNGETREAVENIFYATSSRMMEGDYVLLVNQFSKRESVDVGFEVEIDFKGTIYRFAYDKPLRHGENVEVAVLRYTRANGVEIVRSLPHTTASKKIWNIDTETFQKVNVAMLSPNHWDGHGVGNKHYFFMLDGCQNDGTARGFYNEFLKSELDPHRKVFELVGGKMRTEETINQLSGLGFSSTQRNHAIVRVKGSFSRALRIAF